MCLFYYFNFRRNHDVLKSKNPCTLLNKNINLMKMKRNRKWRDKPCASAHIKRSFFVSIIFSEANFFIICFISMYGVLNTLSEYIYVFISKNTTSYTTSNTYILLVFKTVGSLQRILNSLVIVTNEGLIA